LGPQSACQWCGRTRRRPVAPAGMPGQAASAGINFSIHYPARLDLPNARVLGTGDTHGVERTRVSPVPWTRTSPTPLARPLHAAPLYPAHTRHGEEARVPSNPGCSRCEGDASPTQGMRPLHAACVPSMPRASPPCRVHPV